MPSPLLTIDDFGSGIIDDPTVAATNGFQDMKGLEFQNPEGVLKLGAGFGNEDSTPGLVTAMQETNIDGTNKMYFVMSSGGDTVIETFKLADINLSSAHTDTTGTPAQVPGMRLFGDKLYWASKEHLGQFDGTTWTDNFKTFNTSSQDAKFKPMREYLGSLWIGDGRYLARLRPDHTSFTDNALVLPLGYRIRCMEVYNDFLVMGTEHIEADDTDFSFSNSAYSKVFFWDGVSDAPNAIIDVGAIGGVQSLKTIDNQLYAITRKAPPPQPSGILVHRYNGSDFDVVKHLDVVPDSTAQAWVYPEATANLSSRLVVGVSTDASTSETALRRVWMYGNELAGRKMVLTRLAGLDTASDGQAQEVGAIEESLVFTKTWTSWYDNISSAYGVDFQDPAVAASSGFVKTQKYEISDNFPRLVRGVRLYCRPIPSNTSIDVEYDIDSTGSFTSLGTIDSSNQNDVLYGIYKRANHSVQLKITFKNTDDVSTPELTKIDIY